MASKYEQLIRSYCSAQGVTIPAGFARRKANPIVVIRTDLSPAKLVATTWFKVEDVVYYLQHLVVPEIGESAAQHLPVLDFKSGRELRFTGGARLKELGPLQLGGP